MNSEESLNFENKKYFWDNKIIDWEQKNYQGKLWGSAIRSRRNLLIKLTKNSLKGKTVFESGCGSAGIIKDLFELGIKKYIGCDISSIAIDEAKKLASQLGFATQTEFHSKSVLEVPDVSCDFHFSLGLWDWLEDDEIIKMMSQSQAPNFLHSYSERRRSTSQMLHRMYVYTAYGRKNMSYTPKYRSEADIASLLKEADTDKPLTYRNSDMSFSTFAYKI